MEKTENPFMGNKYTVEGRQIFISFLAPLKDGMIRRKRLFAEMEDRSSAIMVSRLLNLDERQSLANLPDDSWSFADWGAHNME